MRITNRVGNFFSSSLCSLHSFQVSSAMVIMFIFFIRTPLLYYFFRQFQSLCYLFNRLLFSCMVFFLFLLRFILYAAALRTNIKTRTMTRENSHRFMRNVDSVKKKTCHRVKVLQVGLQQRCQLIYCYTHRLLFKFNFY